jgi:hypothetical protein
LIDDLICLIDVADFNATHKKFVPFCREHWWGVEECCFKTICMLKNL